MNAFWSRVDGFLVAIICAVAIGLWQPQLAASKGLFPLDSLTGIGIAIVFFLHGAGMSRKALQAGAVNWRLHLFIQLSTFGLFPLIGLGLLQIPESIIPPESRLGLFLLCALSSTISSSVAMVGIARGNVAAAVFNASLSGILGMMITPILIGLIGQSRGADISVIGSIIEIAKTLLLPFALGHLLGPLIGDTVRSHKRWTTLLDRGVIVAIVLSSFSNATLEGLWQRYEIATISAIAAIVFALLICVLALTTSAARALHFSVEDEITAVFCGSKKSLANGAPIAQLLFGSSSAMGMIVLPLLLYHQFQLLVCAWLARRYADRGQLETAALTS